MNLGEEKAELSVMRDHLDSIRERVSQARKSGMDDGHGT